MAHPAHPGTTGLMHTAKIVFHIRLVHMPHPNAGWLGAFQGRELTKYCYIIFVV